jgi:hypothetical protein
MRMSCSLLNKHTKAMLVQQQACGNAHLFSNKHADELLARKAKHFANAESMGLQ